ncbi:MAG: trimethylamine methyltransferase family protein, partial [Desulfobacterales bacterium]|nr:trimethylamine methyltransferase family protein [Desulfobacterales bacterium]
EKGVVFDDDRALEIMEKNGARIEGRTAFIPEKMVDAALESAPSQFKHKGINDEKSIICGKGQFMGAEIGATKIIDAENGLRRGTLADVRNILKLIHSSPVLDTSAMNPVEPLDIPAEKRHLHLTYEHLKNCDKPFQAYNAIICPEHALEIFEMLNLVDDTTKNHLATVSICPMSPLKFSGETLQVAMAFARNNQIVHANPAAIVGISSPVNLLGTSLQQNVECLALLVFIQLVNPGTPFVFAVSSYAGDLRKATSAWGSPESGLLNVANTQAALDLYHIPVRVNCGPTTSKSVDPQSTMESMQNVMVSMLAGTHLNWAMPGVLDDVLIYSLEKHIIDEESCARIKLIAGGMEFSEEALSVDAILDVDHGGNYLTHPSTLKNFRSRWLPSISNWSGNADYNIISEAGKQVKKRLEEAPETLLTPDQDKKLRDYLESKG